MDQDEYVRFAPSRYLAEITRPRETSRTTGATATHERALHEFALTTCDRIAIPAQSGGRPRTASSPFDSSFTASAGTDLPALLPPRFPTGNDSLPARERAYSASSSQHVSPSHTVAISQSQTKRSFENALERRPNLPYGHHRQTSIVHGAVQHSRNPSLLSTVGTSPLSAHKAMEPASSQSAARPLPAELVRTPSMSALHGNSSHGSAMSYSLAYDSDSPQRRLERMHSGKIKRDLEHQRSRSNSEQLPQDIMSVGQYALHHLFTAFIGEAAKRTQLCIDQAGEHELQVESVCGPGVDAAFDQIISSLGHINRHRPKDMIDAVIVWRKEKSNTANLAVTEWQNLRNATPPPPPQTSPSASFSMTDLPEAEQAILRAARKATEAEHISMISVYLLCRVLIETISQTTLAALNTAEQLNTASRLEEVIYNQVQGTEPEAIAASSLRRANWNIRAQLLGVMSGMRSKEITNRFLKDLESANRILSIKGLTEPKLVAKSAMLLHGMRWIKIKSQPAEAWNDSCDVLLSLARYFAEVHGRTMKHAYAGIFEHLLMSIASTPIAELNSAKWRDVLAILNPKIAQMLTKADHWPYVFPLQAVMLCVSPADQFATQWLPLVVSSQLKVKDRSGRSHVLKAICRLVWRYVYCVDESPIAISKKLDEVIKAVFLSGKRLSVSTDPVIADPLIQLIRFIGYKHQELCFRNIVFPLMNAEVFSTSESQLKIEALDPERIVIAIRAFLAIMIDLEKGTPPPFPTYFECDALMDPSSRSPIAHRRTKSQGFELSAGRPERLSQPVLTTNFDEVMKEYYTRFCKILGQLTIICDNTFGGQAILEEKIATHTPKTPMAEAFTFNKREDVANPTDVRQNYYDLLHVAIEALPRCLSPHVPINSLVNLLCTGTAHIQPRIASSATQSLKSIAKQSYAQQVTIGFARFIFNFDDRYSTVSDSSLLGPGHIEETLKLYVELLEIWIEDVQKRTRTANADSLDDPSARRLPLDLSGILAQIDEIEGHGLFFLCSPSRTVRAIAINILRIVTKFDTALGKPSGRIINILEKDLERVAGVHNERLNVAERSRLQKRSKQDACESVLVGLCSSEATHDTTLWFKLFPNIVRLSVQDCMQTVAHTRELVCQRLALSYKTISALTEGYKQSTHTPFELATSNHRDGGRFSNASPAVVIEQWKIHLIFACTTVTYVGSAQSQPPKASQGPQHSRKSSKGSSSSQEKITSGNELFSRVVPFLAASSPAVRNAAAVGLGATNAALYHTLLQSLQASISEFNADAKELAAVHRRNVSTPPRRHHRTLYLRAEITHVLSLTSHLLKNESILEDDFALRYLIEYARHLRIFLSDTGVQGDVGFQRLRTHFCSLVEMLFECIRNLPDSTRWLSFQSRLATFTLIEDWCGFSPNERQLRQQEDHVRRSILASEGDLRKQNVINSTIEKEKIELQGVALNAMATLCAGPLDFIADGRILMQFDVRRILAWIGAIFEHPSDRYQNLGRKALQNLISHNQDQPLLIDQTIRMSYLARSSRAMTSYFEVAKSIVTGCPDMVPFWRTLCLCLHTLGSEDTQLRMKSAQLLRVLEQQSSRHSTVQELETSVRDKTAAVYKPAQFELSQRLSTRHKSLAFHMFSEFSSYFNDLKHDQQRNMVSAILPWLQTIELRVDSSGAPTATSYMVLSNLFEMTLKSSIAIHHEIQALWQALATGVHGGNVLCIVDYIVDLCLDRKEHIFVVYAKQIVVFMSTTPAGVRVLDHLLLQINPRTMICEHRGSDSPSADSLGLPYIAEFVHVPPNNMKQNALSLGQVCMVLLVDLIVSPFALSTELLPVLLQVALVQWDHNNSLIREQAQDLLVHLIHELLAARLDNDRAESDRKPIEDLIEAIRGQDPRVIWTYDERDAGESLTQGDAALHSMSYLVTEIVKLFASVAPKLRDELSKTAIEWATTCSVRHVACRSFQIFRSIPTAVDVRVLAAILNRLASTIADEDNVNAGYSQEILITLHGMINHLSSDRLLQHPQLFWATCACLDTTFEAEYKEGLSMLQSLISKLNLRDKVVLTTIREAKPPAYREPGEGIHTLLYKGVRSSESMDRSLDLMHMMIELPSGDIVGQEDRLLFTVLANLPRYLRSYDHDNTRASCVKSAEIIALAAEVHDRINLCKVLRGFAMGKYRSSNEFLPSCIAALRTAYFPAQELSSIIFLLGMVNNESKWFRIRAMQVLDGLLQDTDMRRPEIVSQGPDLISPLLRLLPTQYCQQALHVLDHFLTMSRAPLDQKHIRMSMAGAHTKRATRKEYQSTQSLYGIPEATGWSIPMPAVQSVQVRNNVAAIASTVDVSSIVDSSEAARTPEVEFVNDESHHSYFGSQADTLFSEDARIDGNMSALATKLDGLDDFFDDFGDDVEQAPPTVDLYREGLEEEREDLYDDQALSMLRRSLRRNPSAGSFQTGFSEAAFLPAREPLTMNPAAFTHNGSVPVHPGLHNRSITSPAVPTKSTMPLLRHENTSGEDTWDEIEAFSDDDSMLERTHTMSDSDYAQSTVRPAGFKAGWRQGIRRLTNSGARPTNLPTKSPKVPKVPVSFTSPPMSADL